MNNNHSNCFKQIEPSNKIANCVMEKIEKYEKRRCKTRMYLHSFIIVGSTISLVPTVTYLSQGLSQSGFSSYFSLILSDGKYVFSHLSDLALSIATAWPLPASILALGISIVFINSLRKVVKYSDSLSQSLDYQPQLS
jgi:hypothetical protein